MQKKSLPMKVKHSCYRCGERENTRFSPDSTFPYAVLGSLKVIDDYVVILLRIRLIQDASISKTSQGVPSTIAKGKTMNKARTRISPYGWVMIMLLLILGAINFADFGDSDGAVAGGASAGEDCRLKRTNTSSMYNAPPTSHASPCGKACAVPPLKESDAMNQMLSR